MRNDNLIPVSDERSVPDDPPGVLETGAPAGDGGARMVQDHRQHRYSPNESRDFRGRWERIQIGFVESRGEPCRRPTLW